MRSIWANWLPLFGVIGIAIGTAPQAPAAVISEVRIGLPGTSGAYIEITLAAGDGPFDLIVLDARPTSNNKIKTVITIIPAPGKSVVLLHEGIWPAALPDKTQELALTSTASAGALWLGGQATGIARHLVVFSGVTGWTADVTTSSPNQWAIDDILTYGTGGWSASSDFGEPIHGLQVGDAIWRHVNAAGEFTAEFTTGPVDGDDVFLSDPHIALDPGLVNIPYAVAVTADLPVAHHPEPATLGLLAAGALAITARRPHTSNVISPPTCSRIG